MAAGGNPPPSASPPPPPRGEDPGAASILPPWGRWPGGPEGGLRPAILAEARLWLGTPYRHRASARGAGCDCLGLVRGVWRALYGDEPEAPPPYGPDWAEVGGRELLGEALARWLTPIDPAAARPGDVLLFRMAPGAVAKHCAILSADGAQPRMIHAYWGRACVESWLGRWWRARWVGAFSFPPSPLAGEGVGEADG